MSRESKVVPFSLKNAPALIERLWPAQKISVEAQKERKAGAGQTLTALGSYWKGRKPLVLVRACVLGALLPATEDAEKDLAIFEKLMAIDDDAFEHRVKKNAAWPVILDKSYLERVAECLRPEELDSSAYDEIWPDVNLHLGTHAESFEELVEQLGIMRYGHRPTVADTFAGGGSIPFEAARLGCDVFASDLNPIACMLTWGALNIVGADEAAAARLSAIQDQAVNAVRAEVAKIGCDVDEYGNVAKTFLYCTEVRCPQTNWLVPLSATWVVSNTKNVIARLVPIHAEGRFDIEILSDVSRAEVEAAAKGTARDGCLAYELDGEVYNTPLKTIRGDTRVPGAQSPNGLRQWTNSDIAPGDDDIFRERLYCIQWTSNAAGRVRPETFFRAPTVKDRTNEMTVTELVRLNLLEWQANGWVADMAIEPGDKTDEPIRTRGWTRWHHLFNPRQILYHRLFMEQVIKRPELFVFVGKLLDYSSRLCRWDAGHKGSSPQAVGTFTNQALNTLYNYGTKASSHLCGILASDLPNFVVHGNSVVRSHAASEIQVRSDLYITDPPYADAVVYHEITEYFIAWLRRKPPAPFDQWTWDSRRALAVKGEGEDFRRSMVEAYAAMTDHMPDNGMQIVMFTHQSGEVWADMAQIFWGAGLQVMAAWYIATETTSELKKGGYVQGTVILVLRKRKADETGYRDEIVQEIKAEVANQIDTMVGLNQTLKGHGRIENLFEDADLQMAGYAAALRVLTAYARIDGTDMTREALRPRVKGEKNLVTDIIEFAVQVANEHLVPEGMDARVWERLTGSERFYCKMLDVETTGAKKLDNYQNFAKAFRVPDYAELMQSMKPNEAQLKNSVQFKKAGFGDGEFGRSGTRAVLYALYELQAEVEGDLVLAHLRDLVDGYGGRRDDLAAVAAYIANKRQEVDAAEAQAARILHGVIRNERLGA